MPCLLILLYQKHNYLSTKTAIPLYQNCRRQRKLFELYSSRAANPTALALRAMLRTAQRSRSNFARLAGEQTLRLVFASLSAPPAIRFKSAPTKRKIRNTQMGIPHSAKRRAIFEPYSFAVRVRTASSVLRTLLVLNEPPQEQLCLPR